MARLPYPDSKELPPAVRQTLEQLPVQLNVFRMMAHAHSCFIPWLRLGTTILSDLQLPANLREMIILVVANRLQCDYEWVQHVPLAEAAGVTEDQTIAIASNVLYASVFSEREQALLQATAEWLVSPRCRETTWRELRAHFSPREIVEAMLVVGFYSALARILETTEVEIDRPFAERLKPRDN